MAIDPRGNGSGAGPGSRPGLEWKRIEAEEYAKKHGGKLVVWSGRATTGSTWECSKGHQWNKSWTNSRKNDRWCLRCEYDSRVIYKTPAEQKAIRQRHVYRQHDKKKGRRSELEIEHFLALKDLKCVYCDRVATGYDRKDPAIGHTVTNCVPCCIRCNRVKGDMLSYETMIEVGKVLRRMEP